VALTTEKEATLVARFDLLFTEEMKAYVKQMGGAGYLRDLVLRDITRKLSNMALDVNDEGVRAMQAALVAEVGRI
jgi:hypothetical protein